MWRPTKENTSHLVSQSLSSFEINHLLFGSSNRPASHFIALTTFFQLLQALSRGNEHVISLLFHSLLTHMISSQPLVSSSACFLKDGHQHFHQCPALNNNPVPGPAMILDSFCHLHCHLHQPCFRCPQLKLEATILFHIFRLFDFLSLLCSWSTVHQNHLQSHFLLSSLSTPSLSFNVHCQNCQE